MRKWITCKGCGHEYASQLAHCPNCNRITVNAKLVFSIITAVLVVGIAVTGFAIGVSDKSADEKTDVISENDNTSYNEVTSSQDSLQSDIISKVAASTSLSSENKTTSQSSASKNISVISSKIEVIKPTETLKFKIGTEFLGDVYYITMPEYFLRYLYEATGVKDTGVKFNEFAYRLDEDAKNAGFFSIKQNFDGSSTRSISYSKYNAYLTDFSADLLKMTFEMKQLEYIESIKNSNNFDNIEIKLKKQELSNEEYAQIVALGCYAAEKQLSTINSQNSCTVNLILPNGESENLKFPECLNK